MNSALNFKDKNFLNQTGDFTTLEFLRGEFEFHL